MGRLTGEQVAGGPAPLPAGEYSPREDYLIRCAYRVIARAGVHRVTLQDIADEADVSKGVLLYHFRAKENLILETLRWVLGRAAEPIRTATSAAQTPAGKIEAMVDAIFVGPEANRAFYSTYLGLIDYAARSEVFQRLSEAFQSIVDGLYAEVIREGVEQGAFTTPDVEEAARVVRALLDGLFLQWLQEEDWAPTHERYCATAKRAILIYLRATA